MTGILFNTMLISGCGGDIPLALARIARQEKVCQTMLGSDIHEDHPGLAFCDQCFVFPKIDAPDYYKKLSDFVRNHKVDAIIVGSEPELRGFFEYGIDREFEGVPVIMANREALRVGLDKLETAHMLHSNDLPNPWTQVVKEGTPPSLPCILKSRSGSGSKTIAIIRDAAQVEEARHTRPDDIFQEYVGTDNDEYTCGLYRSGTGEIRTLIFRRKLQGGFTSRGEVVRDEQIEALLQRIAQKLDLLGSINVQLRMTSRGPVVFEINPRFSSTVMFRHKLGFQDFVWSLQEQAGRECGPFAAPAQGIKFYRTSAEVFRKNGSLIQDLI